MSKAPQYKQSVEYSYKIPTVTSYTKLFLRTTVADAQLFESDRRLRRGTNIWPPKLNKRFTGALDSRWVRNCRKSCFTVGCFNSV